MIMVIVDDNGYLLGISPRGYVVIDNILLFSYIFKICKCKCELLFFFSSLFCSGHSQKKCYWCLKAVGKKEQNMETYRA